MPLQWKHRVLTTGLPRKSLYVFFGEMSIQIFSPFFLTGFFFLLVLSCMCCSHILDTNPLSVTLLADIFSHSTGCLFILLMVSFAVQKLLTLIRFHLFIFAFISFALGD